MNRRGEVIEYVTRKYGREQVAQIITFNTMAAKAAIKDCGRAMDMPYGDVDRIAKLIPATIGITIDKALEEQPELAKIYASDAQIRELIDTAKKLEGLVRGSGVHAAGVVIAAARVDGTCSDCEDQERRNCDRLRYEGDRKDGFAQDGFSWADHADCHHGRIEA